MVFFVFFPISFVSMPPRRRVKAGSNVSSASLGSMPHTIVRRYNHTPRIRYRPFSDCFFFSVLPYALCADWFSNTFYPRTFWLSYPEDWDHSQVVYCHSCPLCSLVFPVGFLFLWTIPNYLDIDMQIAPCDVGTHDEMPYHFWFAPPVRPPAMETFAGPVPL
jgi:hypothetical protein